MRCCRVSCVRDDCILAENIHRDDVRSSDGPLRAELIDQQRGGKIRRRLRRGLLIARRLLRLRLLLRLNWLVCRLLLLLLLLRLLIGGLLCLWLHRLWLLLLLRLL